MKNKNKNLVSFLITVIVLLSVTIGFIFIPKIRHKSNSADNCEHKYEVINQINAGEFEPGCTVYRCAVCGNEKSERTKASGTLPQIYFNGNVEGIAKDSEVVVEAEYTDDDKSFHAFAAIKYQGHTAMLYDKKNYTVKFYEDENKNSKYKVSLHDWQENSKYCLKANYIDFSQSRNVVSANIWTDVVASRKSIDKNISVLQNYGAIDGYPIMVFINDDYQGLYTMNIPKDDDTYQIGDEKNEALFVINSSQSESAYFKKLLSEEDKKTIFDLEYCYGEDAGNTEWAYQSLNRFIAFVMENDGESFRNGIGQYLDVDSAIDYLLTAYYLGFTDNFAKNVLMLTYDGQKWIFSLYDMDTAFGLSFDGTKFYPPDHQLPTKNPDGSISSSTGSLLWDKLLRNYYPEICVRYKNLRETVLQNETVLKRYSDFIASVPSAYFEKELEIWKNIPQHDKNNMDQMSDFLNARSALLDNFFTGKGEP